MDHKLLNGVVLYVGLGVVRTDGPFVSGFVGVVYSVVGYEGAGGLLEKGLDLDNS